MAEDGAARHADSYEYRRTADGFKRIDERTQYRSNAASWVDIRCVGTISVPVVSIGRPLEMIRH